MLVDPICLSSFLACHLVALDKNPGVRPIGICETVRRIISKSVLSITQLDILEASGSLQLCTGQMAGVEAGIHAVRSGFNKESTEGVLLVDATNAFNSLNCSSTLINIRHLCPALATIVINCYREPVELFVVGVLHCPEHEGYWKTSWESYIPFFHDVLSRNSFEEILWMLHLLEVTTPTHCIDKVKPLLDTVLLATRNTSLG